MKLDGSLVPTPLASHRIPSAGGLRGRCRLLPLPTIAAAEQLSEVSHHEFSS
ncbi:MAG: hypothetical protein KDA38_01890 [Planctomycetales bacterium]|nr:hypothetical protein [Planctomycetales bacterium]